MNPILLALAQWAITGLPELITTINAAHPTPPVVPTVVVTPAPTTATTPDTGWPPPLPPETPAGSSTATSTTSGGSDGIRALQAVLGVHEDGYWGPVTRAALVAEVAAIKAKLGV